MRDGDGDGVGGGETVVSGGDCTVQDHFRRGYGTVEVDGEIPLWYSIIPYSRTACTGCTSTYCISPYPLSPLRQDQITDCTADTTPRT